MTKPIRVFWNAPRTLHVVDIECLFGSTLYTPGMVRRLVATYPALDSATDHVVLGASCRASAVTALLGWPGSRLVWRPGQDGGDLALLEVLLGEEVERRFDRVVIGSGDGIFTAACAYLAGAGLEVGVVARQGSLSNRLRMAAHWHLYLADQSPVRSASRVS